MTTALKDRTPIASRTYTGFHVRPLTGTFGARVEGVQLADAIQDDGLFAELRDAWVRYQLLVFRDQELSPAQHLALGERFGDVQREGYMKSADGLPGVWVQQYPDLYEGPVRDIDWHADSTFRPSPTRGSILHALAVPDGAGDTVWANMHAAFDDLSPAWQGFLEPLRAVHDNATKGLHHMLDTMGGGLLGMRAQLPPSEHPVVATHPDSGRRMLFVSELMTREITGMNERESRAVLDFLFAHQTRPEFQCRIHWRPGTVTIWDNYSTIHRGIFDFGSSHRLMHRVSFNDGWTPS